MEIQLNLLIHIPHKLVSSFDLNFPEADRVETAMPSVPIVRENA